MCMINFFMPYVLYKNGEYLRGINSSTPDLQKARVFSEKRFAEQTNAYIHSNYTIIKISLLLQSALTTETNLLKWMEDNNLWK